MVKKLDNPFIEYGYFGSEYFCDREQETERLLSALANGSNVTLIAPRRIGKTGLIHHAFEQLKCSARKDVSCFYIDIFHTKNTVQLAEALAAEILGHLDNPLQSATRKVSTFFSSLRPSVAFDELTGAPTFRLDVAPDQARNTLRQLFEYIHDSGKTCYLAIDEFQQVLTYPDSGIDAYLRSIIQLIPNLRIIFSGSQQHLLSDMFMSAKHPFFNSSQMMVLKEIPMTAYQSFANHFFTTQHRSINDEAFGYLYHSVDGLTWYVQKILNRLYRKDRIELDQHAVMMAIDEIVEEQSMMYEHYYYGLTENQASVLCAIANDHTVRQPLSIDFAMRHSLPASSSISSALKSLNDKLLIHHDPKTGYSVYDRFFAIWLRRLP